MTIPEALKMNGGFIDRPGAFLVNRDRVRRGYVLRAAAIGLAVAIVARFWMRALTDQPPRFSIGGTGFIFLVISGLGACAGLAFAWRRLGSSRRMLVQRGVGLAPFLLMGPFMVLFVPGLVAALTLAHRRWRTWLRRALFIIAGLVTAFLLFALLSRGGVAGPASMLLYIPIAYMMFLTNRIVLEPRSAPAGQTPTAPDP